MVTRKIDARLPAALVTRLDALSPNRSDALVAVVEAGLPIVEAFGVTPREHYPPPEWVGRQTWTESDREIAAREGVSVSTANKWRRRIRPRS